LNGSVAHQSTGILTNLGAEGVAYFFVLSGFLISWVILREVDQTGEFNVKKFLIRRSLRIWPLYFLVVIVGYLVFWIGSATELFEIQPLPKFYNFALFYVNFYTIENGMNYLFFLVFLWTISVEVQFYLLWAILLNYLSKYFDLLCWTVIITSILMRWYFIEDDANLKLNTLCLLVNFAVGALGASTVVKKGKVFLYILTVPRPLIIFVYLLTFFLVSFYNQLVFHEFMMVIKNTLISVLFIFIILEQSLAETSFVKFGKIGVLNFLGKLSYGLYCFHGIVITLILKLTSNTSYVQSNFDVYLAFPFFVLTISILMAHFSYHYYERFFLRFRKKFY